ncbi:CoA pyrophosphatase [Piscinibacter sakaiensis]|uniref:CoA pyrophosphatase n=1 Tax=Piscinibacter sakaiensis TaxID=1547922 RepID=UPI003AAD26AA
MALNFKVEDLPVASVDAHLPPVASDRLNAGHIVKRFRTPPQWLPEIAVERRFVERAAAQAAVLLPLVQRDELTVLLTQRTDHLHDHPGQVSFPGGRVDPGDRDVVDTALRESLEEIGLHSRHVQVIGQMPTYTTGSGFVVTPVVGLVEPDFTLALDAFEVADVFEVPLSFLMTPAHHRWHRVEFGGVQREFLSMPWDGPGNDGRQQRFFIWGATAAMLRNFYRFLSA